MAAITQRGSGKSRLTGYSDSDLAGDLNDRKSTIGVMFYLGSNLITWNSRKQKVVALSSCKAKYIAATTATCQGIWLLLGNLLDAEPEVVTLKVDNKSAISLSKNLVHHERSKHIDTQYHFIHEYVEQRKIVVEHVISKEQMVDILTKPLGGSSSWRCGRRLECLK